MGNTKNIIMLFLLAHLSLGSMGLAKELEAGYLPLVYLMDLRNPLEIDMYVKCHVREYHQLFDDFEPRENPPAAEFKKFLLTVYSGGLEELANSPIPMAKRETVTDAETGRSVIGMGNVKVKADERQEAVKGRYFWMEEPDRLPTLRDLSIFGDYAIGNYRVFLYGPKTRDDCFFQTYIDYKEQPHVYLDSQHNPHLSMMAETIRQKVAGRQTPIFLTNNDSKIEYAYKVPLGGTAETEHVAYLCFNGKEYNFSILEETLDVVSPTDEAVNVFQTRYLHIREGGSRESVAAYYTAGSAQKWMDWLEGGSPFIDEDGWNAFLDSHFTEPRTVNPPYTVRFVIDAAPLYIVLYQLDDYPDRGLHPEYLVRTSDGKILFTNLRLHTRFDQFISSSCQAIESILTP